MFPRLLPLLVGCHRNCLYKFGLFGGHLIPLLSLVSCRSRLQVTVQLNDCAPRPALLFLPITTVTVSDFSIAVYVCVDFAGISGINELQLASLI